MPSTTINPTRMELTRLKGRLKTAQRGHKLLKDKRDELMKQVMDVVRENRAVRRRVEEGLMKPSIYKVLPITEAEEAHAILQRGENVGKVVLTVK